MDFGCRVWQFLCYGGKGGFNEYAFDISADKNDHIKNMGVKNYQ